VSFPFLSKGVIPKPPPKRDGDVVGLIIGIILLIFVIIGLLTYIIHLKTDGCRDCWSSSSSAF